MRSSAKRFLVKVVTVVLGLTTLLLIDAAISGALPLMGALCLIPACAYLTAGFGEAALRKPRKRTRRIADALAAEPAPATKLRMVPGGRDGKKPPNAA